MENIFEFSSEDLHMLSNLNKGHFEKAFKPEFLQNVKWNADGAFSLKLEEEALELVRKH